jgi:hypothetical protein
MKNLSLLVITALILVAANANTARASSYYQYNSGAGGNTVHNAINTELQMRSLEKYNNAYQANQNSNAVNTINSYQQEMNSRQYYNSYNSGNNTQTQYNNNSQPQYYNQQNSRQYR